jgi:hypothetical protein
VVLEKKYLPKETVENIFKVENLTRPQEAPIGGKGK